MRTVSDVKRYRLCLLNINTLPWQCDALQIRIYTSSVNVSSFYQLYFYVTVLLFKYLLPELFCCERTFKCSLCPKLLFQKCPPSSSICQGLLATLLSLAGRLVQGFLHLVVPSSTHCTRFRTTQSSHWIPLLCRTCNLICTRCIHANGK